MSKSPKFHIRGNKAQFSRIHWNQLWKVTSSVSKGINIGNFKFDCNIKFSKLMNSMCSLQSIVIEKCVFDFDNDWKVNESRRYIWNKIELLKWTLSENVFITLIKIFAKIVKSTQFEFTINRIEIICEDPLFELFLHKLHICFEKLDNNRIFIKSFVFTDWTLKMQSRS